MLAISVAVTVGWTVTSFGLETVGIRVLNRAGNAGETGEKGTASSSEQAEAASPSVTSPTTAHRADSINMVDRPRGLLVPTAHDANLESWVTQALPPPRSSSCSCSP